MTETAAPPPTSEPLFIRPREGRVIAGVCAGIARRWGFDLTLVRIVTAVIAVMSGIGVVAYLATWLLTPSTDGPAPLSPESQLAGTVARGQRHWGRRLPRLLAAALAALLVLALLHTLLWWTWGWGAPVGVLAIVLLTALAVGTRTGRWLATTVVVLVVAAVAAVAAAGPHVGTRTYQVTSMDDLRSSYDYGVGTVDLDLSALLVAGRHHTTVRVGRGNVVVTVPAAAVVVVHARSGLGTVTLTGRSVAGVDAEQDRTLGSLAGAASAQDRLVLDVLVGAGDVDVRTA